MDNKSIYENLFQNDESFRRNFPDQEGFESFVSEEGRLDEVKDLYNYQEPDIEDPVKKKEGRSPFRSLFRFFGDRRETRVEPGQITEPREFAISTLNSYYEKQNQFKSLRSELAIQDLPFKVLASPVSLFTDPDPEGAYSKNPAIIKSRNEINDMMIDVDNATDDLISEFYLNTNTEPPIKIFKEENEEGWMEVSSREITSSGEQLINQLSTEKPDLVATDLGFDKNFLRVPDADKINSEAFLIYQDAFGDEVGDYSNYKEDPRFEIIKDKLTKIVDEGIQHRNLDIELSRVLRKNFPEDKRIQKEGYKAVKETAYNLTSDLWRYTKEKEMEASDAISLQMNEYQKLESATTSAFSGKLNDFKNKFSYDEVTDQYLITPDQTEAFNLELEQLNAEREALQDNLAASKAGMQQQINDLVSQYRKEILDGRNEIINEYTIDGDLLNKSLKEAYDALESKGVAMEATSYFKDAYNLNNIGLGIVQGTGSLLRGASDILDIYFSPFGSAGMGISASMRSYGEELLKYENKFFFPTYEEAGTDPFLLTKKALYDFSRMGPTLLPTIGAAIAGAPTAVTASISLFTDTAMQADEARRQVYEQTGDRIKSEQAAEDSISENLDLAFTYFADAKLLTPGSMGKITGLGSAIRTNLTRLGLNYGEELVQESLQNASTKGILDRYVKGKETEYSFLDEIQDPELIKSVAGMTLISQGFAGSTDTYRQLKQERNVRRVNELFKNKGMANLLNRANKVSENAISGYYDMQYMMGNLTKDQLMDVRKAVKREAQFAKSSNIIAPQASEEKQAAIISLLKDKDSLESQINEIENTTAKETLKKKAKEIDKKIESVSESESLEGFTIIKNKETGTVIAAVTDEEFKQTLASSEDGNVLVDGVMSDILELTTGDKTISDMVEYTHNVQKDKVQFAKEVQALIDRNKKETRIREEQKKKGETPTLTDEEFDNKFKQDFYDVMKARDERVAKMSKDGSNIQEEIDRYKKQNEDPSIAGVEFDPIFNVDENTNFDDIKLTFNNSKISTIVDQVKEGIPMLRQLYGDAKVTFVKSNKEMEALGYKNSDGLFDPDTNTVFINLESATEYTFFHEATHAALIKVFGEDTAVLFSDFVKDIEKTLGAETSKRLKQFVSNYSEDMRPEEYLSQLGAFMGIEQNKIKPGTVTRIKSLIYSVLMRIPGLKDFASKFNNSYNEKQMFDMFNALGKAYQTKDLSPFLKKAEDVFISRSEKNAHLRNNNKKVNKGSVDFAEGVLSELSKEFGISQEQSIDHGIYYDKENNKIVANDGGVISTDQYFGVISDVLLHNYIKNNLNEFLDIADQIGRANYKKLRGLYEKNLDINDISTRAKRSFYSFMANGTQIKNMNLLWDAMSNYYVGTKVNKVAGLYTLGSRYFNKQTQSNVGVNVLEDEKLKELTKLAKGTSIYNVIDLHKNGYDFFKIANRVRQSINRSRIVDIAIDNFRSGNKFVEYSINEDYTIDRPSIDIVNNQINIPDEMTEEDNLRLMYNILLLDLQRNNVSTFMTLLDKMSKISGYENELEDHKARYLQEVENQEEPDVETARYIFNRMVDAFMLRTDELLDDISDEEVYRLENEVFQQYLEPYEIPLIEKSEKIDYMIYKILDPNSPFFSDLRYKNIFDYHTDNYEAFSQLQELVELGRATVEVKLEDRTDPYSMDLDETKMIEDDIVQTLEIKHDDIVKLQEKLNNIIRPDDVEGQSFFTKAADIVNDAIQNEGKYNFNTPLYLLEETINQADQLTIDEMVYNHPELLYDRNFFDAIFDGDPTKMEQYDDMFSYFKEVEFELYNQKRVRSFFENHVIVDGDEVTVNLPQFVDNVYSKENFLENFDLDYSKYLDTIRNLESFEMRPNDIISTLKDDIIKELSPEPDLEGNVVSISKEMSDGLVFSFRSPTGSVIDNIEVTLTYDENIQNVDVVFKSERYGVEDTPSNEKRMFIPVKVANIALSTMSMAPVRSISFRAAESSSAKYKSDPEAFRRNLYSIIGKRISRDFYYGKEVKDPDTDKGSFAIGIPPVLNVGRYQMEFEPEMSQDSPNSRIRESRKKAHKKITDFVEAEKSKGTPASEIYKKAYQIFGDENVRTSTYGSEYVTEKSNFQKKEAMESMNAFAQNFENRRQAIIDFIDRFRDKASLIKIVNILRNGVEFIDEESGFKALDTTIETSGVLNQNEATQRNRPNVPTTTIKFADYEIFSALYVTGETSEDLDKIFGKDYRQTIETAINEGNFSTNILSELSKDAQSRRVRRKIEDLSMLGEIFNDLDPKSVIDYLVSNLDTLGIEPALQNLIERINKAETYQQLSGEIINTISDMRDTEGAMQSVSQLASFAGRVLRLMRQISQDPSEVILENIRKNGRDIPGGLEQKIRDQVANKMKKAEDHKKTLMNAWSDPSDDNIKKLLEAERDLYDANWNLARTLNSEAVQGRYWSDVLQKHGAFALLSANTVVLSAASVLELMYRQQFAPISGFAAFLADKYMSPGSEINGYKIRARKNPLSREFWKSSALAHQYAFDKNMHQMGKAIMYGQTGTDTNLYYDLPAQANAIRDASNFFEAMITYGKKKLNKEKFTDEDLANILERSLIEVDGEKKLIGGKGYQMMASAFRGLNPSFLQSELTARLMPLGLDQYGVNTLMMDSMLDYTSFQMAADYKGMPKGIAASLMERSPEVSLRNAAVLTQSLISAGYIKSDQIEQEALRATFFNTNKLTKGMSSWRKSIRKKMNIQDQRIINELKKGKDKSRTKIALASAKLHARQIQNLSLYASVPFLRVPSNIAIKLISRSNPVGAAVNAFHKYIKYKEALSDVKSQYNKEMGQDITKYQDPTKAVDVSDTYIAQEKDIKKKAEMEEVMMDLYGKKRAYTEAVGDIMFSSILMGTVYNIVASGAVSPSDDPEKRGILQETGLESSELNITMLKEYVDAGGPNMSDDERKKWIASRKPSNNDIRINLINLGTYFGYSLGFGADVYSQYQEIQGDKNGLLFDALQKHFTTGSVLGTMSRTIFKMTPSAQFLEEVIQVLTTSKDYGKDTDNLLANLASASGASFAPSLLGKPLSVSEGMKAQSTREIDLEKEIANWPLDSKILMMTHMRLSRNGIILPGTWRSDFYKSKIGLFGEDLSIRKTMSEPGTAAAYFESMFNYFKLRRETRVMPKNIKDERRLKHEIDKHADVNEIGMGILSMAQGYARLGGDPSSFYGIFNKPLKNKFIMTEYGKNDEGLDMDTDVTMPNDIYRAEARMLGEYKYQYAGEIKNIINNAMSYAPDGKEEYGEKQIQEFKLKLKLASDEINALLDAAEKQYQKDFMANRSKIIIKEMQKRGVLSDSDKKKFLDKGIDPSVFESDDVGEWKLDLYEMGNLNFSDPEVYNSNAEEEEEDLSYLDKRLELPDIDTKDPTKEN